LPENGADLRHTSPTVTAVLVDAASYLKRAKRIFGRLAPDDTAKRLHDMALAHLNDRYGRRIARLYRILVYDAPPALWKGHVPISSTPLDLSRTPAACWRSAFHEALRGMRKVALRLGEVPAAQVHWQVKPAVIKELLQGKRGWDDVGDDDFQLALRQKGVDMRLGLDVASLAYKRLVIGIPATLKLRIGRLGSRITVRHAQTCRGRRVGRVMYSHLTAGRHRGCGDWNPQLLH